MGKTAVLSFAGLLVCFPLLAQENLGRIAGTITDEMGAVIAGVDVTARHEATGIEASVISSASGAYFFPTLAIGSYTVTATQTGFETVRQVGVRVYSGGAVNLDITLPVGEMTNAVTVQGDRLAVDRLTSSAGVTRFAEEIESLPLVVGQDARNSLSFARTLPGYSFSPHDTENLAGIMGSVNGVVGTMSVKIDGIYASPPVIRRDERPVAADSRGDRRERVRFGGYSADGRWLVFHDLVAFRKEDDLGPNKDIWIMPSIGGLPVRDHPLTGARCVPRLGHAQEQHLLRFFAEWRS